MFQVQHKEKKTVHTVYDVYLDETFPVSYFLMFENNDWRWRPASNYIPYEKPTEYIFK